MILQALYELAEHEGLVEDPDFEQKPVSWVIRLNSQGGLVGFEDLRTNLNEGTSRKAKYAGKPVLVPRQFYRAGIAPGAYFLVDNAKFVLGVPTAGTEFDADEGTAYSNRFRDFIRECAAETAAEGVVAVCKFFDQYPPASVLPGLPAAIRSNEMIAFRVGHGDYVHLLPAVRSWWSNHSASGNDAAVASYQCLVTGKRFSEIDQFPQTEGVPGAAKPIKVVSFNSSAFESYGLKKNENAAISPDAAVKAATALNRLLNERYPSPREPGVALPPRSIRLGADTAVCFWSCSPRKDSQDWMSVLPDLLRVETENSVGEVYRSVWRGKHVPLEDPTAFYVLILSGAQGRAVVRDWIVTTLPAAMDHLSAHFGDVDVVRNAQPKKGVPPSPAVPLESLMKALAPEGKGEAIPSSLEAGFLRAAFTGLPYPFQILQRSLVRARAEIGRDEWIDAVRRDARAALLKGVLNRRRRLDPEAALRYPEVKTDMSPNLESEGYALGQLMAVLERLQTAALGDVNASVIDRYFGAASATPRSVFVRLLKNAQHHARKALDSAETRERALAARLRRLIDVICDRFDLDRQKYPPRRNGLPAHLDLEQQGLFVLGYHQMRHWLWLSNEERRQWELQYPDAPEAYRWIKAEPVAAAD